MIEKKPRLLVCSFNQYWVKVSCMLDPIYSTEGYWFLKGYDRYGLSIRWPQGFLCWKLCPSLWHYWNAISPAVWNTLQPEGPWLVEVCHWAFAFRGHNLLLVSSGLSVCLHTLLPRVSGLALSCHSTLIFCSCSLPQAIESDNHGQKSLKIWQKCLYSLRLFSPCTPISYVFLPTFFFYTFS